MTPDLGGEGLSLRDLVLEIRSDVKDVEEKISQLERDGSIGTRRELDDHELRLRKLEVWRYGIPVSIIIALGTATAIVLRALGL